MTPTPDPFAALVREFELELVHLKQMLALAEEEQRDLVTGDMARLDAISAEKLAQLHALELYTTSARSTSPRRASRATPAAWPPARSPPGHAGAS